MRKRKRCHDLLPDAASEGSPEQRLLNGCSQAEYQRAVSSPDPPPEGYQKSVLQPNGKDGPTVTFSTYNGARIITKVDKVRASARCSPNKRLTFFSRAPQNAENVCMEGYLQRLLANAKPGSCPEVRWIRKCDDESSVTMDAGEDIARDLRGPGLNILTQVADCLQNLAQEGVRFRHGDLHFGNIVRTNTPIVRRARDGNAIRPLGDKWAGAELWYNLRDDFRYQMIDFGMSALQVQSKDGAVAIGVPNEFYDDDAHDPAHDLRCLVTCMWTNLWVANKGCFAAKRERGGKNFKEWFPWALECMVRRAAETNEEYALAVDVDAHAELTRLLLDLRGQPDDKTRAALKGKPRLLRLYMLAPSQWEYVWRTKPYVKAVNIAHSLYEQFIGQSTPIFEPSNMVAVCCWVKWKHDQAWHGDRHRGRVYDYDEFRTFCANHGM